MTVSAYDAHPFPIYNARYRVFFPIYDNDGDLVTAASGLDSELSQNQGTFADATNEATEIATSSGIYYLDLIATELDTKSTGLIVKTTTTDAKTTVLTLYPVRLPVIRTGTAQAGATTTITLDSGASATNDFYNGCYVNITNDSPSNALGQARRIIDYVGSTKVAHVEGDWGTNPSSASTFEILLTPEASSLVAWAGTVVADPTNVGVPEVDQTHLLGTAVATPTVAGVQEVDVTHWLGTGAATPTTAGVPEVDVTYINGVAAAAVRLALSAGVIIPGTVDTTGFTPTTTQFDADDITEATANHYNNRVVLFTSGALLGQAAQITAYSLVSGRGRFTVTTMTEAPANNDTFIII